MMFSYILVLLAASFFTLAAPPVPTWSSNFAPFGRSVQTDYSPALCEHDGTLYIIWTPPGNHTLLYGYLIIADDGTETWEGPLLVQDQDSNAIVTGNQPAIFDIAESMQLVFPAPGSNMLLHYTFDDDSGLWTQNSWSTSPETKYGVALAEFQDQLFLGYVSTNDNTIGWAAYSPPDSSNNFTGSWGDAQQIPGQKSGDTLGLFVASLTPTADPTLNLIYGTFDSHGNIYQLTYNLSTSDKSFWPNSIVRPSAEATGSGVSAGYGDNKAFIAFKEHKEQAILVPIFENGVWQWATHTGQAMSTNAAIVPFEGTLYCAFRSSTDPALLITTLDLSYQFVTRNWMSSLHGGSLLSTYTIPGTHDTMAGPQLGAIEKALGAKTQGMSLTEQYISGIRFVDMRLAIKTTAYTLPGGRVVIITDLQCKHGILWLDMIFELDVLGPTYEFLIDNPTETIIMSVKIEDGSDETQFWGMFQQLVDKNPAFWHNSDGYTGIPILDSVRGQIVLFRRSSFSGFGIPIVNWTDNVPSFNESIEFGQTLFVEDLYAPTYSDHSFADKIGYIQDFFLQVTNFSGDAMYVAFTSAANTPPSEWLPQDYALGSGSLSGVNEWLLGQFTSQGTGNSSIPTPQFGSFPLILVMDYPEDPDDLIAFVIAQNFGAVSARNSTAAATIPKEGITGTASNTSSGFSTQVSSNSVPQATSSSTPGSSAHIQNVFLIE